MYDDEYGLPVHPQRFHRQQILLDIYLSVHCVPHSGCCCPSVLLILAYVIRLDQSDLIIRNNQNERYENISFASG